VSQIVLFLVAALVAVSLVHYYLWRRLVRDTVRSARGRRLGGLAIVGLSLLLVLTLIGSRVLPHAAATVISWPGYLWLAVMFYLLITLAVLELPALVARRWRPGRLPSGGGASDAGPAEAGLARRVLLARTVAITAGVASAGIVGYGVTQALGPPQLRRVRIPLTKLPRGLDGYRIALVSDIHLGPLSGVGRTRRIVDMINGLDADLVAIVGDLVDGSVAELGSQAEPLRDLRSRQGSFFVTGNHEYFSGYQDWITEVASLGVRPLRNERLELPGGLDLAGVNDATGAANGDPADYDRALGGRDRSRPVVLLAHQPIQAHEAAARAVDLQLSGHTHGGQLRPFDLVVRLSGQPVVSGLGRVDGMPVYVTNGAGFWGPPVRVGAPPDVTLVQLTTP
jgi:predicted MPP superfamily phosphohydrolase